MTTYPPGKHPNSQANLIPWKPGFSPNPNGRPRGVMYVSEWVNILLGRDSDGNPKYGKSDLEKIVKKEDADVSKSIAAAWLINCARSGENWVLDKDGKLNKKTFEFKYTEDVDGVYADQLVDVIGGMIK